MHRKVVKLFLGLGFDSFTTESSIITGFTSQLIGRGQVFTIGQYSLVHFRNLSERYQPLIFNQRFRGNQELQYSFC